MTGARDNLRKLDAQDGSPSVLGVEGVISALNEHFGGTKSSELVSKAAPISSLSPVSRPSYACTVAPTISKVAVRIKVDGADKSKPGQLLRKVQDYISGESAEKQMRNNNTEVF